ncbi:MAG TPA: VOC family protein [Solirubrobacteraceae bacterium]|nr:VOC family protein [Solirubrobacteraceae bacterium]
MAARIDIINLGVNELDAARDFYEAGFGAHVIAEDSALKISLGSNASCLALRGWDAVADGAGVRAHTNGFRAFTLSYILESAEGVDQILSRLERHGGQVSKPPRNAVWGYSAYVTDPSGYLWKIASSKRRPLLSRREPATNNGHAINPQEVPITIGVADMRRAKAFYEEGLGLPVKKAFGTKFVMFSGEGGTSDLGMYKREALAKDAAVPPEGSGFHGFSLTHVVDTPQEVDELLARVARAGGEIVRPPAHSGEGGHSATFADFDGNFWQVTSRD